MEVPSIGSIGGYHYTEETGPKYNDSRQSSEFRDHGEEKWREIKGRVGYG
jgi:hypothetical protein